MTLEWVFYIYRGSLQGNYRGIWRTFFLHRVSHVALPCYYSSSGWTYQSLALEWAFWVFCVIRCHRKFSYVLRGESEQKIFCQMQSATAGCHWILHTGPLMPIIQTENQNFRMSKIVRDCERSHHLNMFYTHLCDILYYDLL